MTLRAMTLEEFRAYAAEFNVIPVSRRYLADSQTPLSLYKKLAVTVMHLGHQLASFFFL